MLAIKMQFGLDLLHYHRAQAKGYEKLVLETKAKKLNRITKSLIYLNYSSISPKKWWIVSSTSVHIPSPPNKKQKQQIIRAFHDIYY